MSRKSDSGKAPRRRIDGAVKARFVAALRAGVGRDAAAKAEGFSAEAFYCARQRDALFRSAWVWAMEMSAVEEREARRAGELGAAAALDGEIQPNNKRLVQRRRKRGIGFTDARKQLFLDHFAGTADAQAACDAAGIHFSTMYKHRRTDPVFAAGWDAALAGAYPLLEAELVRKRLEAQRRGAFEPVPNGGQQRKDAGAGPEQARPEQEQAGEFERVMKLLDRLDRQGRSGVREARPGRQKRMSFEEAIAALDGKLRALGLRRGILPPPDGGGGGVANGGEGGEDGGA